MAREPFLIRTDAAVMTALRRWARDELRSVNSQVEFLLRRALIDAGRLRREAPEAPEESVEPIVPEKH